MKKKILGLAILGALVLQLQPASAARYFERDIKFPVAGTVGSLHRLVSDCQNPPVSGCRKQPLARLARCEYLATGSKGVVGYVFAIQSNEKGRPFALADKTPNAAGLIDFDITFYEGLGTCESNPDLGFPGPTPDDPAVYARIGNEAGTIPNYANWGIVTMYAGANGTFGFRSY